MALIRCPECGKEISDSAQVCPNCGCKTELGNQNEIMKTSLLVDIGFTVLGIICAIFAFVAYYTVSTDAFVVLIILAAVLFISWFLAICLQDSYAMRGRNLKNDR